MKFTIEENQKLWKAFANLRDLERFLTEQVKNLAECPFDTDDYILYKEKLNAVRNIISVLYQYLD